MEANISQFNWPTVGNAAAVSFLQTSLLNKKLASAYIFSGPGDVGKFTVAKYFANSLIFGSLDQAEASFSQHGGDLQILELEESKKNIGITQVRELIKGLNLSSFLNSYKLGIIKDAESLSIEAANALLKTLEEPKNKVVIILLTNQIAELPKTIISRSQVVNFYPVDTNTIYDYLIDKYQASRSQAKEFSRLSLGRPALAVKFLEDKSFYQQHLKQAQLFINFLHLDENSRLREIKEVFANTLLGGSGREVVGEALSIWESVGRDILLFEQRQPDLMRYTDLLPVIEKLGQNNLSLQIFSKLDVAKKYLAANVSPKAVVENLALSF